MARILRVFKAIRLTAKDLGTHPSLETVERSRIESPCDGENVPILEFRWPSREHADLARKIHEDRSETPKTDDIS